MWTLYMIRCGDGTLYTGITTEPVRRLREHAGTRAGAKYLRGRGPLRLVFRHEVGSRGEALRLERLLKRLPRREKERLVDGVLTIEALRPASG